MQRSVPYAKLSKKKRRELDARRRATWGAINPVTRKPANPKAYRRQKTHSQEDGIPSRGRAFLDVGTDAAADLPPE